MSNNKTLNKIYYATKNNELMVFQNTQAGGGWFAHIDSLVLKLNNTKNIIII